MRLAYTRTGTPDAPAIVFLHGMAMGQWMWTDQIQHFEDYDCYNVDLPGHGGSNRVPFESFEQAADCVAELIQREISEKPVYLVGMSLGAMLGTFLLARHPHLIRRAVLTGAVASKPPRWMITLQGTVLSALLPTRFGKRLFAGMLQLPADVMPAYTQSIQALSMPAFRQIIHLLGDFAPPENMASIITPTLFVTGDKDIGVNRAAVPVFAEQVPQAVGVYAPDVRHGWNGEDPVLFNEMTRAWLESKPLPERLIPAAV